MSFINNISSMSTSTLAAELNKLSVGQKVGVEAPIYTLKEDGAEVCQLGTYRSTLVSFDLHPILNPGVSGTVYFAGLETHSIKARLNFQVSVWGINSKLQWEQKKAAIKKRIKWLVKAGDTLEFGDIIFQEDLAGTGTFTNAAKYSKGQGDFKFKVTGITPITAKSVREDEKGAMQLNLSVEGYHVVEGCNNQKIAAEATKACFVPNPLSKTLKELEDLGGFIIFEGHVSPADIKAGKAVRVPHVLVAMNAETTKGNQITAQLWAATKFCMTGERTNMPLREVSGVIGLVSYPEDNQVDEINTYIDVATRKLTGVRCFSEGFAEVLKDIYAKNPNVTWDGNFMFLHGEAMFGMQHTTTELSLTEENRSSGGKIFWEAVKAIDNIDNTLGQIIYATGYKNRKVRDIQIAVATNQLPDKPKVWNNDFLFTLKDGASISSILSTAPKNLVMYHSMGHANWVSTELAFAVGLSPEGGVNLIARCVIDLIKHHTIALDNRDQKWLADKDSMLSIYHTTLQNQILDGNRNKLLKDSSKSSNLVYTMKVRGIESPWMQDTDVVYMASNDLWASKFQGQHILYWRNPNPSFKEAKVQIVGPATDYCPNPDILLPKQVIAKATLTIPAINWYGIGNGDDDGDLVNWISIDELSAWAVNPKNEEAIKQFPSLHQLIYLD